MKIVIAGFGAEGRSNYRYFRDKFPAAEMIIADQNPIFDASLAAEIRTGKNVFSEQLNDLTATDLVVRTAGLPPRQIKTRAKIWSATNGFFANCPAQIIGVTGTKGKGTTCSLAASILRAAGKNVHLVGNIGVPSLDVLAKVNPGDVVIYELSSFQLWDLEKSPHVAVVLMIEADHLDKHADFADYIAAKTNIVAHQNSSDTIIFNGENSYSRAIAEHSAGQKINYLDYSCDDILDSLTISGEHNRENARAAILAAQAVDPNVSEESIRAGLRNFTGLPHRLKFISEERDVRYFDDSISTTPGSAIAALKAFVEPKIIILGGHDKGADYSELAREISVQNMRLVILCGENSSKIAAALSDADVSCEIKNLGKTSMREIVRAAKTCAHPGDVVILSPASASFDQYKSYEDRGQQFVDAVRGE